MLDEPTVVYPLLRREAVATRFTVSPPRGATLLVSTHVMDEAPHCDELVLVRDGRIVATGAPSELREETHTEDLEEAFLALAEAS